MEGRRCAQPSDGTDDPSREGGREGGVLLMEGRTVEREGGSERRAVLSLPFYSVEPRRGRGRGVRLLNRTREAGRKMNTPRSG